MNKKIPIPQSQILKKIILINNPQPNPKKEILLMQ